jgi:hypothetical protein
MSSQNPGNNGNTDQQESGNWIKDFFRPLSLFTGILVIVVALQTCILHNTDLTLSDTLMANKAAQRAYVFPALAQTYFSNDLINPVAINFLINFANNGNTATKNLIFFLKCAPSAEDLDEPWILIDQGREKTEKTPGVLGPKGSATAGCSFTIDQLKDMANKKLFGYILIDVSYEDGLSPGVIRKTQVSMKASAILYVPAHKEGNNQINAAANFIWENKGKHNCADEDCLSR